MPPIRDVSHILTPYYSRIKKKRKFSRETFKNDPVVTRVCEEILSEIKNRNVLSDKDITHLITTTCKKFKIARLPKSTILEAMKMQSPAGMPYVHNALRTATIRGLSGVTVITVLTKPFHCPGKCVYCPLEPGMPKSYISSEPGAQRAVAMQFDPFRQVTTRIEALTKNGHIVDKVELIILGGTWSAYPPRYQSWFIKKCFDACTNFRISVTQNSRSLEEAHVRNESAQIKIIGVTIETRPDHINKKEIRRLRKLGCTRVQLGVQSLDDAVLTLIERGHDVQSTVNATALLRSAGFKIDYHIMPNLPGSNPESDVAQYAQCFTDGRFIPDQIKIYPCIVNKYAPLYQWWKEGKWIEYPPEVLEDILTRMELMTPPFVRLNRLIRDIPGDAIDAGNKVTNLRQIIEAKLKKVGTTPVDIRYREAREDITDLSCAKHHEYTYHAAEGTEVFISFDSPDKKKIYGFCRLRLPHQKECWLPELKDLLGNSLALVRELHVYGQVVATQPMDKKLHAVQHGGLGKKLMEHAEKIAKKQGYRGIAVIAGVGTRNYYRKLGYERKGSYMVKYI